MHAQQDSYSHESFGATFGHSLFAFSDFNVLTTEVIPFIGNYYELSARVDKTAFDPNKAEIMARNTFEKLLEAKSILNPAGCINCTAGVKYEVIEKHVRNWVRAETEQDKKRYMDEIMKAIS